MIEKYECEFAAPTRDIDAALKIVDDLLAKAGKMNRDIGDGGMKHAHQRRK